MNIGHAIKLCRVQRGLNQTALAQSAGLSGSFISLLERGKRDVAMSAIERISQALNLPVFVLFTLAIDETDAVGLPPDMADALMGMALRVLKKPSN